ncbi:MAG: 3-dehydroquinate synthase [Alphaproteobacteria bacterium]|nr:3-dehydroquinate synthase [Alphaproteobacteria bacterium]
MTSNPSDNSRTIQVDLGERSYDIAIGPGLVDQAGRLLAERLGERPTVIVTDTNVASLYAERLESSLSDGGHQSRRIVIEAGEASKSYTQLEELVEDLIAHGLERSSVLIALGGGVIGDLTGFAASIALRGVEFVQIPTSLLAQVDSSVGGKTAINSRHGKNLVGAFYQPRLVLADTETLSTLPPRELRAGYAETVKYGLLGDAEFFAWLEDNGASLLAGDGDAQIHAIERACEMKAEIVNQDERETGRRALLNLGHTFAHALEAETGYDGALLHGEAVAIGMILAFDLSAKLGLCPPSDAERVRAHLSATGLPTAFPEHPSGSWNAERLLEHIGHDKKVQQGRPTFVLARGIGDTFLTNEVASDDVVCLLDDMAAA